MSTTSTRKIYPALDIAKFVMAMFILTQHTCNEWAHSTGIVHAFFGLGNFAVPFFFACSGFLFFTKLHTLDNSEQKKYYRTWSIRIGKMYLVWSLIYFCFVFIGWINTGFLARYCDGHIGQLYSRHMPPYGSYLHCGSESASAIG